ncbi:MAG: HEAT repeat domain-containing protein [Pseudomonadota bacterium]
MNPWYEVVDRFKIKSERFEAAKQMTDGRVGSRANRGRVLEQDKMDALIWGLRHESPVVRRCCLEFLDTHQTADCVPHIVKCLDDPVPRVRWHAVHALICDGCKPGTSYLTEELLAQIRNIAENDPNAKVRSQAEYGLSHAAACGI